MRLPLRRSEWDYRTIKELVEALQVRKISASELMEHTIARIEAFDRPLNAVVVRDFERAREAAKRPMSPWPAASGARCSASR